MYRARCTSDILFTLELKHYMTLTHRSALSVNQRSLTLLLLYMQTPYNTHPLSQPWSTHPRCKAYCSISILSWLELCWYVYQTPCSYVIYNYAVHHKATIQQMSVSHPLPTLIYVYLFLHEFGHLHHYSVHVQVFFTSWYDIHIA